jgi:ectoine hydroxylase
MHQFKINGKMAFEGDVWQWHQDYGTWLNDDLMPEPRAMNIAIFLDDVYEFNGPLMFIPGSHKKGVIDASHDLTTTSYPLWTISNELISQLVNRAGGKDGGIVSPKGPAGSMLLFHSCLVHASSSNLSPFNRVSVYLSLCAVSNHIRRYKRPEYIAHRNFTPIVCLPDDCLLKDYPVDLPWKDGMPESALKMSLEFVGKKQLRALKTTRQNSVLLPTCCAGGAESLQPTMAGTQRDKPPACKRTAPSRAESHGFPARVRQNDA